MARPKKSPIGVIYDDAADEGQDGYVTFWETKNGKARRIPISPTIEVVLANQPRIYPSVFANSRTGQPLTANGVAHVFNRAVGRGIVTGDVTLHTLRHTALSRMIAGGYDDYTVMSNSGHSATRMLERYTHPTEEWKIGALNLDHLGTKRAQRDEAADDDNGLGDRSIAWRNWWTTRGSNS